MKAANFRDLSRDELASRERELREQHLKLRFQQSTGQIESPQMLRSVRKDIARVKTILRERELELRSEPATSGATESTGSAAAEQTPAD